MITLNKKEYQESGLFKENFIQEYCNLKIYPLAGVLEREAGLLSDLAECYRGKCNLVNYGDPSLETNKFFLDNLEHFDKTITVDVEPYFSDNNVVFARVDELHTDIPSVSVVLAKENEELNRMYKLKVYIRHSEKLLYLDEYFSKLFQENFGYYFENGEFVYDNLICYAMIVKNAGPLFEKVLTENLPIIDRWCILDTGSTDGTQDVIRRVLANKKGRLYEEPFINFRDSRNRCLELAGKSCRFVCMLDDTYVVRGNLRNFLQVVRGDQFADSFSLLVRSDDTEYYSNRITKSRHNLRYIYTIHEVIQEKDNVPVVIPTSVATVFDYRAEYMEKRTINRKKNDLELLFKEYEESPDDPRSLYYIAQTYACMDDNEKKAEYFLKRIEHPNQGFLQEKVDACFELARTYNFKLDKPWELCEKYYRMAIDLDPTRPDSIYFIGCHYWLQEKNTLKAYEYFKKAFEIGYPVHAQYSLKPTLSFHFLPILLARVCYIVKDFTLGFKATSLFLQYNNPTSNSWNQMNNWNSIYTHLQNIKVSKSPNVPQKPIFCIVTDGGWSEWNGFTSGLGGSETWIIETAKRIPEYDVRVFCKCSGVENCDGVLYTPISEFSNFICNNIVEYCIVSRFTEYVPLAIEGHANTIGIIFHDLIQDETVIPLSKKIRWVFCLTDFHKNIFTNMFPDFAHIAHTLHYGIDEKKFFNEKKIKNSFIFSSFPNRGLLELFEMWTKIVERYPDATLNVYCDFEHPWTNRMYPEYMKKIKEVYPTLKNVVNHGWVSKETLAKAWSTAQYWLYPCIFIETFCLTALEAAITKTFALTTDLGALRETVGDRGILASQDQLFEKLITYMESPELCTPFVEKNYEWAKQLSWDAQTRKFLEIVTKLDYFDMYNWTTETNCVVPSILATLPKGASILEIGTFTGTSVIKMLELVPDSTATVIDPWLDYDEMVHTIGELSIVNKASKAEEIFYKNIQNSNVESRVKVIKGKSSEELFKLDLTSFDFIYIDGSHKCLDVYLDAILAWRLLRKGGILGFDDYLFNKNVPLDSPYEAINHFLKSVPHKVLSMDYRVFIRKV